jgi:hypothetical protein
MAAVTSTIAAGLTIAGGVAAGIGAVKRGSEARNKDTLSAAKAAEEIRNEQIALQNRETTNAKKGQLSQLERVTDDIRTNVGAANANASDSLFANFVESTNVASKTGFAGSSTVDNLSDNAKSTVRRKTSEELTMLENRKGGAVDDFSTGIEGISIADAKGRADIEERFSSRIAEIGSVADTFMEGVFGSDNEIEGYNYG